MSSIKWFPNIEDINQAQVSGTVIIGIPGNGSSFYTINDKVSFKEEYLNRKENNK